MTKTVSLLHQQRIEAVLDEVCQPEITSVLDLGCGEALIPEIIGLSTQYDRITGIDICPAVIKSAMKRLEDKWGYIPERLQLHTESFIRPGLPFSGFDMAILVETIEHIEPHRLSMVERSVFARLRPGRVVITTPNHDFNHLLGVPPHRMRHPGHFFEWSREKYENWCRGVAKRNRYKVSFRSIGGNHPDYGGPTQMAVFCETDRFGCG